MRFLLAIVACTTMLIACGEEKKIDIVGTGSYMNLRLNGRKALQFDTASFNDCKLAAKIISRGLPADIPETVTYSCEVESNASEFKASMTILEEVSGRTYKLHALSMKACLAIRENTDKSEFKNSVTVGECEPT